jgi:protein phosphatase
MLVCPQCQFENPNTNKFCQECGAALTQNACPECDRLVPFDTLNCPECGAIAGVTWWAIVADNPAQLAKFTPLETVSGGENSTVTLWLDTQKRYRILESLPAEQETLSGDKQFRVLDHQPFQLSLLEAIAKQEETPSLAELPAATAPATSPAVPSSSAASMKAMTLPAIAQPYLALEGTYCQALPTIHDTWQQDGQQTLLLEDRSQLPLLLNLWLNEELELPQLQVLHWLYEMVELWNMLEPLNYQQSLLIATNLHVDEDQAICLQRLYRDPSPSPLTLQNLGQFWQSLFTQSQRTQFGSISLLLAELESGQLSTVSDLRAYIEAIAYQLQANQPDTDFPPDLENMESVNRPTNPLTEAEATSAESADVSASVAPTRLEVPLEAASTVADHDSELDNDDLPTVVLPMQLFNLEDAGRTDIGRQRDHNEDYFGIETQVVRSESPSGKTVHVRNLYILCDGMGGHAGGEVASALAVDTLRQFFQEKWQNTPFSATANKLPAPDVLIAAVQLANKAIYDVNQKNARSGSGRMGTTLVMLLVQDTEIAIAHVGDSRLYRYTRKRGLEQITIDHEVGQREIQRGVDSDIAYARPDAYQLTQALGPRDEHFIKPDVQYLELNEDALLLLCSDGLSDNDLLEKHCKTHLEPLLSSQNNLEQGVSQLIDLANQYNGHDNITAIGIRAKVRPNLEHLR